MTTATSDEAIFRSLAKRDLAVAAPRVRLALSFLEDQAVILREQLELNATAQSQLAVAFASSKAWVGEGEASVA